MAEIFISYSSNDRKQAQAFVELLEGAGHSVWIDRSGIGPATHWSGEIVDAIRECSVFIVLLSRSSVNSMNVVKEVSLAAEKSKRIIPIELEAVILPRELEYHLVGIQRTPIDESVMIIRALEKTTSPKQNRAPASSHITVNRWSKRFLSIALAVVLLGGVGYFFFTSDEPTVVSSTPRIAVLPFENLGGDSSDDYFADGITTELINSLSKVHALSVTDRITSMAYREKKHTMAEAGAQLGVNYLVEGTVRKDKDNIKVTASLFDVANGKTVWSGDFPGTIHDILSTQEKITKEIVAGLQLQLTEEEKKSIVSRMTGNAEAYDLYLKGYSFRLIETPESEDQAIQYLQRALTLDPNFVEAHIELGMANLISRHDHPDRSDSARAHYKRALELEPNNVNALSRYAQLLVFVDKDSVAALAHIKKAIAIEPANANLYYFYGHVQNELSMAKGSAEAYKKCIELMPSNINARINLYIGLLDALKDTAAAVSLATESMPYFRQYLVVRPESVLQRSFYIRMLALTGQKEEALRQMEILFATVNCPAWLVINAALTCVEIGEIKKAESILHKIIDISSARDIKDIKTLPGYAPIRTLPNWSTLNAKIDAKLKGR